MKLGLPVIVSQLGHVMVGVVDSAMVGQLGPIPLAASALANSSFFIVLAFGIGLTFGITPLVAAEDGEGKQGNLSSILKSALAVNTLIAIGMAILVAAGSYFLHQLNQPPEVASLAAPYLRVVNISGLFFIWFQTAKQFAEGKSDTRSAMVISVLANLLNVFLNWILIFGKLGFEPMGLMGAGYATLISRIVMAIVMWLYIFNGKQYKALLRGFAKDKISKVWAKRVVKIGVPSGLQFFFEVGAFAFAAIMVGWISAEALAAHQIALSCAAVTYMLASGVAAASTVRIGNQVGSKNFTALREIGFSSILLIMFIMGLAGAMFILLQNFLPGLFIEDVAVIKIAAGLLLLAAAFQLADGVQVVCLGMLRGMEDTKVPTYYTLISYWFVALPLAFLFAFSFNWGVEGVWLGLSLGLILVSFLLFFRFKRLSRKLLLKVTTA